MACACPEAVSTAHPKGWLGREEHTASSGLAIAKLNVRQAMDYTVAAFIPVFVVFGISTLIMPFV